MGEGGRTASSFGSASQRIVIHPGTEYMANVAVIGAQWGDEGKGKIVDWLSARADVVVRFQGGHNAGHTLVIDGKTYKLSLLPSGVVRPGKLSIIGNGVVVDPWAFLDEIERVDRPGVARHARQSGAGGKRRAGPAAASRAGRHARESATACRRIGTTKRGIGPAYEDKVGRRAHARHRSERSRHACRPRSSGCSPITMRCAAASAQKRSTPARCCRR